MAGSLTGRLLNNRYQIIERIGVGGMAEVYRAQDNVLGRTVAVKVMLPQYAEDEAFAARFRQEAAAAANLSSPYIVNVYDWGQDSGTYYIVMEYVRGSDLKTAIKQRGAIAQRKVAEIGSQVCQALSVAHNMDIVHRDIKPQNIMIQPDGNVKVMDFGIARAKNSNLDITCAVLGTAHYISPEQAQDKEITGASDIYSLGIVMYESVTGQLPFDGADAVSVALKQVKEAPVPPSEIKPDIDRTLEAIILKAMAKDPRNRFSTAQEMRRALNDFLAGRPVTFDGFDSAKTAVISNNVVPPISATHAGDTTKVLPATETTTYKPVSYSNGKNTSNGTGTGSRGGSGGGTNKAVIIAVAVIAALAVIGVLAFALLSGGSGGVEVPDVTGKTRAEATTALEHAGFKVGNVTEVYSDTVESGKVISQDPKAGSSADKGSKVNLTISQGAEKVQVPDITDMSASDARRALQQAGLKYEAGAAEHSNTIEENRVARQNPAAGEYVAKGSTVVYYLSAGKEDVEVPKLEGMSEGTATTTLTNAGLKVNVEYRSSNTVEQGYVIESTPRAGEMVKPDSTVNIVVSTGPMTHYVSAYAGEGGSVSPSSTSVNDGGSVTFSVYAYEGYSIGGASDSVGNYYDCSGGSFTVYGITGDLSVSVTFVKNTPSGGGSGGESGGNGGSDSGSNP